MRLSKIFKKREIVFFILIAVLILGGIFYLVFIGEEDVALQPEAVCVDGDTDGYGVDPNSGIINGCLNEGNDCDDGNANVNPGAAEVCGDGVDNDCDGGIDEGCGEIETSKLSVQIDEGKIISIMDKQERFTIINSNPDTWYLSLTDLSNFAYDSKNSPQDLHCLGPTASSISPRDITYEWTGCYVTNPSKTFSVKLIFQADEGSSDLRLSYDIDSSLMDDYGIFYMIYYFSFGDMQGQNMHTFYPRDSGWYFKNPHINRLGTGVAPAFQGSLIKGSIDPVEGLSLENDFYTYYTWYDNGEGLAVLYDERIETLFNTYFLGDGSNFRIGMLQFFPNDNLARQSPKSSADIIFKPFKSRGNKDGWIDYAKDYRNYLWSKPLFQYENGKQWLFERTDVPEKYKDLDFIAIQSTPYNFQSILPATMNFNDMDIEINSWQAIRDYYTLNGKRPNIAVFYFHWYGNGANGWGEYIIPVNLEYLFDGLKSIGMQIALYLHSHAVSTNNQFYQSENMDNYIRKDYLQNSITFGDPTLRTMDVSRRTNPNDVYPFFVNHLASRINAVNSLMSIGLIDGLYFDNPSFLPNYNLAHNHHDYGYGSYAFSDFVSLINGVVGGKLSDVWSQQERGKIIFAQADTVAPVCEFIDNFYGFSNPEDVGCVPFSHMLLHGKVMTGNGPNFFDWTSVAIYGISSARTLKADTALSLIGLGKIPANFQAMPNGNYNFQFNDPYLQQEVQKKEDYFKYIVMNIRSNMELGKKYLVFGIMEEPLQDVVVDFEQISTFNPDSQLLYNYPIPAVVSSVWKSPEDNSYGIFFANWEESSEDIFYEFKYANYGIPAGKQFIKWIRLGDNLADPELIIGDFGENPLSVPAGTVVQYVLTEAICVDADLDGYYASSQQCSVRNDCNDNNININPEATEICTDQIDNDCDTLVDCDDGDCSGNAACSSGPTGPTSSSGGGGGGGSGGGTPELNYQGLTRSVGAGTSVAFKINNSAHTLKVVSIANNIANIQVSSTPQNASLSIGETKKFNLDDDNDYDVKVTLQNISASKANLFLARINEQVGGVGQCRDGIDNDNDGKIDWPNDSDCESIFDEDEGGVVGGDSNETDSGDDDGGDSERGGRVIFWAIIIISIIGAVLLAMILLKIAKRRMGSAGEIVK